MMVHIWEMLKKAVANVQVIVITSHKANEGLCEQTLNEVVVKKLEEKHGAAYSVEKLNI